MVAMILSATLFFVILILIFTEKVNRTIAGLIGAVLMIGLGMVFHFYTEKQAAEAIDTNTIGLLLGMMLLIALLEPTGFLQYLAVQVGRLSKGRPVVLLSLLGLLTSVLSMFLDNVTTVVLIAPITLVICEILGLSPRPFLISEAILSNTGGIATLVGDPPNVLIASAAGFVFTDFLTHSLPIVVVVWGVALLSLRFLFRKELPDLAPSSDAVYDLNPAEALIDRKSALKVLVVVGGAMLLFLFEEALVIQPAFIALSASAAALIWIQPPVQDIFKRVQWDVLVFFGSLFIMIGGLKASGALEAVASVIMNVQHLPTQVFGLIVLWTVALLSAVVDNIPITIALIPIIQDLGKSGMPTDALWWALVLGAGLGGNGTIIGSTANVVVASLSEKTRLPITNRLWNKTGLPVMVVTCSVASVLYLVLFNLISSP